MADISDEKEQLKALEDLYSEEKFSEVIELYEQLSVDFPDSFQIKFVYGRSLLRLDHVADAEEVLTELVQSFPDNINLLQEVGNLYSKKEDNEKAIEYYDKILFLDPFNALAKKSIEKIRGGTEVLTEPELKPAAEPAPVEEEELDEDKIPKPDKDEEPEKKEIKIELEPKPAKEEIELPEMAPLIEPEEKKEVKAETPDAEMEFVTESAAELYMSQGHYDEALSIYEKLYNENKDDKFLDRMEQIKGKRVSQKKIDMLSELLDQIQKKGDELV